MRHIVLDISRCLQRECGSTPRPGPSTTFSRLYRHSRCRCPQRLLIGDAVVDTLPHLATIPKPPSFFHTHSLSRVSPSTSIPSSPHPPPKLAPAGVATATTIATGSFLHTHPPSLCYRCHHLSYSCWYTCLHYADARFSGAVAAAGALPSKLDPLAPCHDDRDDISPIQCRPVFENVLVIYFKIL